MDQDLQFPPIRVSVVIPTYNRAADVKRALDSVISQTLPVAEIIVVDDGSTDNTREVVAGFNGSVQYVCQENAGPAAARNRGIRMATGDWIAFLDSDDWWFPDKIRLQVEVANRNPRAALVYTSAWIISSDGTRVLQQAFDPAQLWPTLRYSNVIVSTSCVMVRREAIVAAGCFQESMMVGEDWGLWVRLARKHPFAVVSEPVLAYSITHNSLSQDPERTVADTEHMMEETLLFGLRGPARLMWRRRIRAAQIFHAAVTVREIDQSHGRRLLVRSLLQWPSPFFLVTRWKMLAVYLLRRTVGPAPDKT